MSFFSSSKDSKHSYVKHILAQKLMDTKMNSRKKKLFTILSAKRLHTAPIQDSLNGHILSGANSNLIDLLQTNDDESMLKGLIIIRNMISVVNPPIKEVFSQPLAIKLIHLIDIYVNDKEILLEILWIITNFSYGDSLYTKVFIDNDIVSRLTLLIHKEPLISYSIIDQLAWLIANFSVDSIEYKQSFFDKKYLEFFLNALEELNISMNIKENILRAISNIIQGISFLSQSKMKYKLIQHTQSIIRNFVIFHTEDLSKNKLKCMKYSIQILFYLTENQEEVLRQLLRNDIFKYLLQILKEVNDDSIILLIVYFINSVCELEIDAFLAKLLEFQLLTILSRVMRKKSLENNAIVKAICQLLNTISRVSTHYLNCIIASEDLICVLFTIAKESKYAVETMHFDVFEVIANFLETNSKKLVKLLINKGVIDLVISYFSQLNEIAEMNALTALYSILEYLSDDAGKLQLLLIRLDREGLIDKIKNNLLRQNPFIVDISEQIYYSFYLKNNHETSSLSFSDESCSDLFFNSY